MKPVTPSSTISGIAPLSQAMTGVPQAIASITTSPNGSGQSIGNNSAAALPRKAAFSASPISPIYSTSIAVDQRLDRVVEIGAIVVADLGGDLELQPGPPGDLDGAVGPLVARQPAEEGEVAGASSSRSTAAGRGRAAGRDGWCRPSSPRCSGSRWRCEIEIIGKRGQRRIGAGQIAVVEPAVRRRHRAFRHVLEEREMQEMAEVEMDDVELVGPAAAPRRASQDARRSAISADADRAAAPGRGPAPACRASRRRRWQTASPRARARPARRPDRR